MYCPNCGKEIETGSVFCSYCGKKTSVVVNEASTREKTGEELFVKYNNYANSESNSNSKGKAVALASILIIVLGSFLPFLTISVGMFSATYTLWTGDFIILAIIGAIILFVLFVELIRDSKNKGKDSVVAGVLIILDIFFQYYINRSSKGEISFGSQTIEIERQVSPGSGFGLIIIGAVGLIVAGSMMKKAPGTKNKKRKTDYISMVVDSCSKINSNITFGKAFENFFEYPSWRQFDSIEGKHIVEFSGKCMYEDSSAAVVIQFVVESDASRFRAERLSINGAPKGRQELDDLLNAVFGQ